MAVCLSSFSMPRLAAQLVGYLSAGLGASRKAAWLREIGACGTVSVLKRCGLAFVSVPPLMQDYHQQYLSRGGRFSRPQSAGERPGAVAAAACHAWQRRRLWCAQRGMRVQQCAAC